MKYLSVLSLGLKETNLILNHSLAHIKKAKGSFKPTLFSKINRRKFLRNRTTSSEFHSYLKKKNEKLKDQFLKVQLKATAIFSDVNYQLFTGSM